MNILGHRISRNLLYAAATLLLAGLLFAPQITLLALPLLLLALCPLVMMRMMRQTHGSPAQEVPVRQAEPAADVQDELKEPRR